MSWWSWAVVGYVGLMALLLVATVAVFGLIELRFHLQRRRIIRGAERFLADLALSGSDSSNSQ